MNVTRREHVIEAHGKMRASRNIDIHKGIHSIIIAFLLLSCKYIIQNPSVHYLEVFRDFYEILDIFSSKSLLTAIVQEDANVSAVKDTLSNQISCCIECIINYHGMQELFKKSMLLSKISPASFTKL
jgi:ABC-type amino acid transport system permease subunit